jgi:hypothetical protein
MNVYIVGYNSNNMQRPRPDGTFIDIISKEEDNIKYPITCCFNRNYRKFYVVNHVQIHKVDIWWIISQMFMNLRNQNSLFILKVPDYYTFYSLWSLFDFRIRHHKSYNVKNTEMNVNFCFATSFEFSHFPLISFKF